MRQMSQSLRKIPQHHLAASGRTPPRKDRDRWRSGTRGRKPPAPARADAGAPDTPPARTCRRRTPLPCLAGRPGPCTASPARGATGPCGSRPSCGPCARRPTPRNRPRAAAATPHPRPCCRSCGRKCPACGHSLASRCPCACRSRSSRQRSSGAGKPVALGQRDAAVDRRPAHDLRLHEMQRPRADLPDARGPEDGAGRWPPPRSP